MNKSEKIRELIAELSGSDVSAKNHTITMTVERRQACISLLNEVAETLDLLRTVAGLEDIA